MTLKRPLLCLACLAVFLTLRLSSAKVAASVASPPGGAKSFQIRVGLATDLDAVDLPCCDPHVRVTAVGKTLELDAAIRIRPAGSLADRAIFRLQVAALKDEQQAKGIAERLQRQTGEESEAVFDAGIDLYRVRHGRFESRADAERARGRLEGLGIHDTWIASEGGDFRSPATRLTQAGQEHMAPGRWVIVETDDGRPIRLPEHGRFRGRLLIYLNARGRLNLINELSLEDYLRGVVPKEMGPEHYGQLEALKAQAIAARTFTLRNLGEFAAEGYDICSTPRCQVYGGRSAEHPLSDRAVAETAGQVVAFGDELAETFYSATCGGHTEHVENIFPLKSGAYLRGVPCLEAGTVRVGLAATGGRFPHSLLSQLLPSRSQPPESLGERLETLAALAGLQTRDDRLRSHGRGEIQRYVGSLFDMRLDPRLLGSPEKLKALIENPPSSWRGPDQRLAQAVARLGLLEPPQERPFKQSEAEELLFELALYLGVLQADESHFLAATSGRLRLRHGAHERGYVLPPNLPTFRAYGGDLRPQPLTLMAGDPIQVYRHQERLLALALRADLQTVKLGDRSKLAWRRFRSDQQLRTSVQARYPGFPYEGFEVLERGISGRVAKMRLLGQGGRALLVEGLPVRWTFDLRDTRFTAERQRREGGGAGWLFSGSGWGHGVGLCQAGSYGMAMRGSSYQDILSHYYTGIDIVPAISLPLRPNAASLSS